MFWIFVLSLTMASFGGPVEVTFQTTSLEACQKLRRVVDKAYIQDNRGVGTLGECRKGDDDGVAKEGR